MKTEGFYHRTLEILDRLVAFPTVSATSNLALIDYVEDLLKTAGFETYRLPDPALAKSGLMARIGGARIGGARIAGAGSSGAGGDGAGGAGATPQAGAGGLLLSAHSDVVPIQGQSWTRPPFELTREETRLYGRGTTDMKGFLAAMLSLAERAGKAPPAQALMLSISYDEEVGCQGIRKMMPGIEALGWLPELCIVGEPTAMRPAIGHKGKTAFIANCQGTAGHSSLAPRFVNALHLASDFLSLLRQAQRDYASSGDRDLAYDVPYSTVHAGRMQGGTALNIVPDQAEIEFELRNLPDDRPDAFLAQLKRQCAALSAQWPGADGAASIQITQTNAYPGLEVAPDSNAAARVAALCGCDETIKVAFGTEAGFFAQLGVPTVVCGPGDMAGQGHKADEYLDVAQLAACDQMMDRVLASLN